MKDLVWTLHLKRNRGIRFSEVKFAEGMIIGLLVLGIVVVLKMIS